MEDSTNQPEIQTALIDDRNFLKEATAKFLQSLVEEEFMNHLGVRPYERSQDRQGHRNGYYTRQLKTRVGSIELTIPRDRNGTFSTELFDRYQRSEKALVFALAEMYLQGVSTRKVGDIVEELLGHSLSKSHISDLVKKLDKHLEEWRERPLEGNYAYLQLDAIYLKVREGGRVNSVATFIAVGITKEGFREVIGCHVATSEHKVEWKAFLRNLKIRGLNTPEMVASDDHDGLREAIVQELTNALWQRCQVHYARNFAAKINQKHKAELLPLLQEVLHADTFELAKKAKELLIERLLKKGLEGVAEWFEETIDDALNVLNLPIEHRKRMRSTNMLERLNEEVRRRTKVIRIFPNRAASLRLVTAICQDRSESWEGRRYLNFEGLE